jgi:hypothetical protein
MERLGIKDGSGFEADGTPSNDNSPFPSPRRVRQQQQQQNGNGHLPLPPPFCECHHAAVELFPQWT